MKTEVLSLPDLPGGLHAAQSLPQPDVAGGSARTRTFTLLIVLALLAVGWAVYGPVTGYDFIPLDDPSYVYENQSLSKGLGPDGIRWAFTSLEQANWHPLTWLSLMADYQLYALNPGGYHLTNLLFHEAATVLLFLWLLLATRRLWPSAAAAFLFCVHPAHVESVAWVTERKDVLSTLFFFLVLLAYTRYAQTKKLKFYFWALAALMLGLLAKPMLVTVPPLLLLVDAWPLGRLQRARDLLLLAREKIPFAVLAAGSCVITFIAQNSGGATVSLANLPFSWRIAGSIRSYVSYVGELFWPVNLTVFYSYKVIPHTGVTLLFALGLLAATAGAVFLARSKPYLLIGWLWFLGMLVPVIGLVQVGGQSMADRYTYQPYVGLFLALCWGVADLWQHVPRWRPVCATLAAAAAGACLTLCTRQVAYWQNGVALFEHSVAVNESSPRIIDLLGDSYARLNRYPQAEKTLRRLLHLDPSNANVVTKLGYLELEQSHWEKCCLWLRQVAALRTCKDPVLFNDYGFALFKLGRFGEAQAALRHSIALRPSYPYAHSNLGDVLLATGQSAAATAEYEKALAGDQDLLNALTQLSWQYAFADPAHDPQRAARALKLAQHAVDLTRGATMAGLDSKAAAQAALNDWEEAAISAQAARLVASNTPGLPAADIALRSERAEAYRAGRWPAR